MITGIKFWTSIRFKVNMKLYWILFAVIYLISILISLQRNNPFYFFFISLVPYLIYYLYLFIHRPYKNLVNELLEREPVIFNKALNKNDKKGSDFAIIINVLLKANKKDLNKDVLLFYENYLKSAATASRSLIIWIFTFIILLLFFISQR